MRSATKAAGIVVGSALAAFTATCAWGLYDYIKAMKRLPHYFMGNSCEPHCLCQCSQISCGCHEKTRTPKKT